MTKFTKKGNERSAEKTYLVCFVVPNKVGRYGSENLCEHCSVLLSRTVKQLKRLVRQRVSNKRVFLGFSLVVIRMGRWLHIRGNFLITAVTLLRTDKTEMFCAKT